MMNNGVYEELFERTGFNTREDALYKLNAIIEAHPQEHGWEIGEPEIFQDFEGKFGVRVPLKKYPIDTNTNGRSI